MPVDRRTRPRGARPDAGRHPVRAGVLKAGIDYWSISPFEHRVLEAVGLARTGPALR